jgi:hypothetical protein
MRRTMICGGCGCSSSSGWIGSAYERSKIERAAAAVADVVIGCAGTGAETLVPS